MENLADISEPQVTFDGVKKIP